MQLTWETYSALAEAYNRAEEAALDDIERSNEEDAERIQAQIEKWETALSDLHEYLTETGGR